MGPLLMTGLMSGASAIAIGIIASSSRRPAPSTHPLAPSRRLELILTAFAVGAGVWGILVGLLAVTFGAVDDPGTAWLAPVLAIGGAIAGLLPIVRNAADLDPWLVPKSLVFIGSLVVLAIVVAMLAVVIHEAGGRTPEAWPFAVTGLVGAASLLGLGVTGARSVTEIGALGDAAAVAPSSRALARIVPFQAGAVGAAVVAIVLIVQV
jgi:hypothetical protein